MEKYIFLKPEDVTDKDVDDLLEMLESFFTTQYDSEQMQINGKSSKWVGENIPECSMIIKFGDEVVGSAFIIPCTKKIMEDFISSRINEAELVERVKAWEPDYKKMKAIYLCSAFVKEEHRGKGLTLQGFVNSIKKIVPRRRNIVLFYWAYSKEGKNLAEKIAKKLKMKIFAREKNDTKP